MSIERRLERLEREGCPEDSPGPADSPEQIRESAEHINSRSQSEGDPPVFEITPDGRVFTLAEPRLAVTSFHQTLAEVFFSWELEWHESGSSDLVFDEVNEEFRTRAGGLALSRTYVSFSRLMGEGGGS